MLLFATIAREGSFTRAAELLGVTKQTTSERLARLESQLGVRLLHRTTRHLRLTDAGARYFERCLSIAAQIEEANQEVRQQHAEPSGWLRVSTPVLYGRRFLAPVVADYLCRYPEARVDLVLADRRVNLVEEGFDLAIRIGPREGDPVEEEGRLVRKLLGPGHVYYVASPSFVAQHGIPSDLRQARCIGTRPQETWEVDGEEVLVSPRLLVNDLEVAAEAAIAGVGVARLPSLVCRDAVEQGRLVLVLGATNRASRGVWAVYPTRRHLPAKVRVFLDALTSLIAPMEPIRAGGC